MVKKGFSLVEALVVMTILAVFFAFGARVITQRPKLKKQLNEHGYYECFFKNGYLEQRWVIDGFEPESETTNACKFDRTMKAAFFNVHLLSADYKTEGSTSYSVEYGDPTEDWYQNSQQYAAERIAYDEARCRKTCGKPSCNTVCNDFPFYRRATMMVKGEEVPYYQVYNMSDLKPSKFYYYWGYEPNISDVLTFAVPISMKVVGEKYSISLKATAEGNAAKTTFKNYVKNTHPSAQIYDKQKDEIYPGVMIVW